MLCFLLVVSLWASGCSQEKAKTEKEDPLYSRAKLCLENKAIEEALQLFKKLTYRYERAPESHLELGLIFLNEQKDPLAALYHFRAYLDFLPYSDAAPMVRQLMHTATKEFILQLPGSPAGPPAHEAPLLALRLENEKLKQHIQALEARPLGLLPQRLEIDLPPTRSKIYTVEAGDTLSAISTKVYGTPKRWQLILDANRSTIPNPRSLKIGQELIIP